MGLFDVFKKKSKVTSEVVNNEVQQGSGVSSEQVASVATPVEPVVQTQVVVPTTEVPSADVVTEQVVSQPVQEVQVQQESTQDVVAPVDIEPPSIVVDPNNVLEMMQNNFAAEVEREKEAASLEADPMSVFNNQNIELDSSNPMSVFGAESEENYNNNQ